MVNGSFPAHDLSSSHFLVVVGVLHLIGLFQELIVDIGYVVLFAEPGVFLKTVGLVAHQRQLLGQLTQVIEFHTKHLFSYGQQHPCNGHVGQLIVWQIQRKTHAFDFPEPPQELQGRFTVSLLQGSEVDELLFRATAEVMGVEFPLQLPPCANLLGRQR
jgi:hypothetical protein